jgi:hypothetical protein
MVTPWIKTDKMTLLLFSVSNIGLGNPDVITLVKQLIISFFTKERWIERSLSNTRKAIENRNTEAIFKELCFLRAEFDHFIIKIIMNSLMSKQTLADITDEKGKTVLFHMVESLLDQEDVKPLISLIAYIAGDGMSDLAKKVANNGDTVFTCIMENNWDEGGEDGYDNHELTLLYYDELIVYAGTEWLNRLRCPTFCENKMLNEIDTDNDIVECMEQIREINLAKQIKEINLDRQNN